MYNFPARVYTIFLFNFTIFLTHANDFMLCKVHYKNVNVTDK